MKLVLFVKTKTCHWVHYTKNAIAQDIHHFHCPSVNLQSLFSILAPTFCMIWWLNIQNNPFGFCLNVGSLCSICLTKGKGKNSAKSVDPQQSQCPRAVKLLIATAHKLTPSNPCTNVPLKCPLCREGLDAVWKYNFHSHIISVHPTVDIT